MRRLIPALLTAALPVSLLAFAPAVLEDPVVQEGTEDGTTQEEPTEPVMITPETVERVFHLHGDEATASIDDDYVANLGGGPLDMDSTPGTANESRQLMNYVGGPNTQCTGNNLFPTFMGYIGEGTIVGDAVLTFNVTAGLGGEVIVDLWADVTGQNCNEAYIAPDATGTALLPTGDGTVEVTIPLDGLDPSAKIMIMVYPNTGDPLAQGRMSYDDGFATLTMTCQPDDVEDGTPADKMDCNPYDR